MYDPYDLKDRREKDIRYIKSLNGKSTSGTIGHVSVQTKPEPRVQHPRKQVTCNKLTNCFFLDAFPRECTLEKHEAAD